MGSFTPKSFAPLDPQSFSDESKAVVDFIAEYYRNIEKYPVRSKVQPGYLSEKLPDTAPFYPESLEDILKDVSESILPGLTHWQSPNFFAYFQANASTAGFIGEMLCSGFNVVGFNWISSPAATELESIVMDWMGKMLKLPSSFLFSGTGGGVLQGSTTEAVICTLAAARDKALETLGGSDNIKKLVVYTSDQTHFTVQKSAKLIGITKSNFRVITTSFSTKFALSPENLRAAIEEDIKAGLVPLYLCGTVGTTACGAVDPIKELGKIAREYKMWFHVDAAYAGSACICPEFRPYLDGVELADSISLNSQKWFLTNMDCCCMWLKQPKFLIDSLSCTSEYLRNSASESNSVIDYTDWQIAVGRRFKALKLWIVIRKHGLTNLIDHIRSDVDMAKRFEELVAEDHNFEIVVPRKFALVCFRMKPEIESDGSKLNRKLLDAVNSSGRAFMTHGVVGGTFYIRAAIGATMTEEHHVDDLWKLIKEKAQEHQDS
ncbi:hypothetical protein Dsin_021351 [Dipteronia sinensis]|uniref:Tyrosine decarboxylase n=1 Tax=Dipteronia sinensis TaxID=43782 RepID=A0AAE0DYX3_9ROSI|nr:hypothetical protein Dsin_021351 [Dipteronia sinensis]